MKTNSSRHCLLVIDDEPDMVQSVMDLLRFDYRVLGTTRVDEAERIMDGEEVHVVMTDQRMPGMTGVEFLKSVRESHPDTIRLLFTAYADIETVVDAINQGNVYRYITKPWEPPELKAILRQASDQYDLQTDRKRLINEVQDKNRQLQTANDELLRASDIKNVFIRVASHELRTPMTVILGLAELAAGISQDHPTLHSYLEQIRSSGRRLNDRINQMVQLLLTERFERPVQRRPVDVADLLRRAVQDVASFIEQRKQSLKVDIAADVGTQHLEEEMIYDSVVQLLLNAIKFTPDGGAIELSARRRDEREKGRKGEGEKGRKGEGEKGRKGEGEKGREEDKETALPVSLSPLLPFSVSPLLIIQVTDHGTGIAAENLPYIFDPFFTRFDVLHHSSGTFEFGRRGLGLGLSVVKAFVEMHGGLVRVESEPGRGATFTMELPFGDTRQ